MFSAPLPVPGARPASGPPGAHLCFLPDVCNCGREPYAELGFVTAGKDNLGNEVHYVRVLHKVQAKPARTPQENNSALSFEFDYTAYPTATDIEGGALASRRIDTKYVVAGPWNPASPIFD